MWAIIWCFLQTYSDAITAIATALLAIVTFGLGYIARQQYTTSRAQLRAYVVPQGISYYDGTTVKPRQKSKKNIPYAEMTFKNAGQTPAYDLISFYKVDVGQIIDEERICQIPPLSRITPFTVGPGLPFPRSRWFDRVLNPAEIAGISIAPTSHAIFVFGRIEYDDAFGKHHFTNFRYAYCGVWPPSPGGANVCINGNDSD